MQPRMPFTFGIPLMPRVAAQNWPVVEALFGLTLTSVLAQTDQDFRAVILGHDRPQTLPIDPRITFIEADWPSQAARPDNLDRGRKVHAINNLVLESGGGLLILVDADDWVDVRLVETARAVIGLEHVGGVIDVGFAVDFRSLRAAALPDPRIFEGEFHRVCGSSTVAQLRSEDPDPLRRNPYEILHDHHRWIEGAEVHGANLIRLPVFGIYVINTSQNHSEMHGPHTAWRRGFTRAVNQVGVPIDDSFLAQFGLSLDQVRTVSRASFQRPQYRG